MIGREQAENQVPIFHEKIFVNIVGNAIEASDNRKRK